MSLLVDLAITGHALSAAAHAALAVFLIHSLQERPSSSAALNIFIAALFSTSLWSVASMASPFGSGLVSAMETVRNGAWLLFMIVLPTAFRGQKLLSAAGYVYTVLYTILAFQLLIPLLWPEAVAGLSPGETGPDTIGFVLRMLFVAGALMLVHDLYRSQESDARWGISLPLAGLAAFWCYDLNLYTIAYLGSDLTVELQAARGFMAAIIAVVFALGSRRNARFRIRLSRKAAFHSASLGAVALYILLMVCTAGLVNMIGGSEARLYSLFTLVVLSILGLLMLPSDRFRSWLRVKLAKHFFPHRYDYRDEWMRFTDTIGRTDHDTGPLYQRVLKAVCAICESPGAILLMPDRIGHYRIAGRWNWDGMDIEGELLSRQAAEGFERNNFILDLENARKGIGASGAFSGTPSWALAEPLAWIMLPFVHLGRLTGIAVLRRPRVTRPLDWEDIDMLRVASAQAASYLAEAQGQETVIELQRFDQFNRRFAFIMHDIKNLVSQLSLLARNAERHADNPEFRADMIDTLQGSVGRLNDLLARLSQHHKGKAEPVRVCELTDIVKRALAERKTGDNITLVATHPVEALADPARVSTILGHLVQNAIDASPPNAPVEVRVRQAAQMASVSVVDTGSGISEEFLREKLFRPFSSDKEGGFGIGAYEAQMLARAMGGRIDVESQIGIGSRFTLYLPLAVAGQASVPEREDAA